MKLAPMLLLGVLSLATACGIAAGNTLEAVMGGWLLLKVARFNPPLTRLTDVLALTVLAAGARSSSTRDARRSYTTTSAAA